MGVAIGPRTNMDALDTYQQTGVAHSSNVLGKMLACEHDGQTAMRLSAAKYLSGARNFNGNVNLIF